MTPQEFVRKWKPNALTERAAAQEHFLDLCRVFEHPTPSEDDPTGDHFTFEKGVTKTGGGGGYADVWKKGSFAWEYKKKRRNLDEALTQLTRYAAALENPPLHVVCDTVRFRIETRWTNEVPAKYEFELETLADPDNLKILRAVFHNPEELRSKRTRAVLTKMAADKFQAISDRLQRRNTDREAVAHFVNQLVFCFFANSVKLLPNGMWKKLIQAADRNSSKAKGYLDRLFGKMDKGGEFDLEDIAEFNGGLFDGRGALALEDIDISQLFEASSLEWGLIDPTIFGTLFERFLDPDKRAQIGAHYTDPDKIMLIVEPVVIRPLRREWDEAKKNIEAIMAPALAAVGGVGKAASRDLGKKFDAARAKAEAARDAFIDRLCKLRVLDPACGSGNFLYLALQAVKDIEYRAILECETLGLGMVVPRVGPEILHGIEINPFAAELARTTIWIGDIQWRVRNAIQHHPRPVLRKLDSIECRDALLTPDGQGGFVEADWPEADCIIGNPPFLGDRKMIAGLGEQYVGDLRGTYQGRVPGSSDLICYWLQKGLAALQAKRVIQVGFVATNSVTGGNNLPVMREIADKARIFEAWSDEPWTIDGAAVRVALICYGNAGEHATAKLDGDDAEIIGADLTSGGSMIAAIRLKQNESISFIGTMKNGAFNIPYALASSWLALPLNPNGRPNSDVLSPWTNGSDLTRRASEQWIIDFGPHAKLADAIYFEAPFERIDALVRPHRETLRRKAYREIWWRYQESQPKMRDRLSKLLRYICSPRVSKYRVFVWVHSTVVPDSATVAIARDDDTTFGILHSRFHEAWSLRLGTWLGVGNDPRYTPTTTFETYPFPEGLTPNIPAADYAADPRAIRIAAAAKKLDDLRRTWLNPPDLVDIVPEITPTAAPGEAPRRYPDRILPKTIDAAVKLKERTLTNLYNLRPRWLADAHEALDRAVAAAYGWPEDIATEDALARLLTLNLDRAARRDKKADAKPSPVRERAG